MASLRIRTKRPFDGETLRTGALLGIVIREDRITEISEHAIPDARSSSGLSAAEELPQELDASTLTILPGLIDAHFHPSGASFNVAAIDRTYPSNLRVLAEPEKHLQLVVRGGKIILNRRRRNLT